jgi:hypothetical protein
MLPGVLKLPVPGLVAPKIYRGDKLPGEPFREDRDIGHLFQEEPGQDPLGRQREAGVRPSISFGYQA